MVFPFSCMHRAGRSGLLELIAYSKREATIMTRSMTAFARQSQIHQSCELTWELRSVNSRYLELHFKLPEAFRSLEPLLRDLLKNRFARGKIECALRYQAEAGADQLELNQALLSQLIMLSKQLNEQLETPHPISPLELMKWPGALQTQTLNIEALSQAALAAFHLAVEELESARAREGAQLALLIQSRIDDIRLILDNVKQILPELLAAQVMQLGTRLESFKEQLDPSRLEQEMVILAQKADVAEELDRLETHLQEVERVLGVEEASGRRLDFLMQELNREANTLASKSIATLTTHYAVDLKVLIEQMREQIQNIE
ncbi:YicC/YloC family endoribonuclease [Nitrincola tibetensis]